MSRVAIKGNASGTGTFTLEAPDSNDDRTLVLPDEAGTVLTSASGAELSGADFTGQVTVQTADASGQTPSTDADELVLENNGNAGMTIVSSDGGTGSIRFNAVSAGSEDWANIRANYGDNELRISTINSSNMTFRTNNSERMRIDSSGRMLMGTSTAEGVIAVSHTDTSIYAMKLNAPRAGGGTGLLIAFTENTSAFTNELGNITCNGSNVSYNTSSDYRLKENVVDLTDAITRVKALAPKRFNFIANEDGTTVDGFLAHEAQAVVPEAVTGEKDAVKTVDVYDEEGNVTGQEERPVYQGIDQAKLVPLLTGALKEAIAKIETLEAKVAALEATP